MHLILTGATGLVGSAVLDAMIKAKDISRISILSRRPVKMAEDSKDPRINVIIHEDFRKYDSDVLNQLRGASGVVWALGISQNAVSKEEYVKITKDYALEAAKAFEQLPADQAKPFRFVYVSGDGATHEPGLFTPIFGRVKGETELALAEMRKRNPLFHATAVRPSFVDAHTHEAIAQYIPRPPLMVGVTGRVLGPMIRSVKRLWSPTESLGQFLTGMAMGKFDHQLNGPGISKIGDSAIVENSGIWRLMDLAKAS